MMANAPNREKQMLDQERRKKLMAALLAHPATAHSSGSGSLVTEETFTKVLQYIMHHGDKKPRGRQRPNDSVDRFLKLPEGLQADILTRAISVAT